MSGYSVTAMCGHISIAVHGDDGKIASTAELNLEAGAKLVSLLEEALKTAAKRLASAPCVF